jgi:predicted NAD/FAD-dependent oxidoreductase
MRVVVVGAGLSGLVAARELAAAGVDVRVVDKGRGPGGRLATRRIAGATLDHGAQFFTVRTPQLQRRVDDWLARGLVRVWTAGFDGRDGHPRYIATHGMSSLAKDLANGLDVECSTMAFGVHAAGAPGRDGPPWTVAIDDGTVRHADSVIVTCPLPQSFALLVDAGVELDERLFRVDYDRTLALLAVLDRGPAIPAPGGVQRPGGVFSFIGDNAAKGVSSRPAVTFHATPEWSAAHWDDDSAAAMAALTAAAGPWLGDACVVEAQLKRWRFATPRATWPDPCWSTAGGTLVVAGDAFAGPRVEGAHNSGLAAAAAALGTTAR